MHDSPLAEQLIVGRMISRALYSQLDAEQVCKSNDALLVVHRALLSHPSNISAPV
jgi:hypothetical protein